VPPIPPERLGVDIDASHRPNDRELADETGDSTGAAAEIEPSPPVGRRIPYVLKRRQNISPGCTPDGEELSSGAGTSDPPSQARRRQRSGRGEVKRFEKVWQSVPNPAGHLAEKRTKEIPR
jgi:hypothetical protein